MDAECGPAVPVGHALPMEYPLERSSAGDHRTTFSRRDLFSHMATGIGAAALSTLLPRDAKAADAPASPNFAPKAKRVIYLFQSGAPSQLDLFDYKPKLAELRRDGAARFDPPGAAADRHDLAGRRAFRSRRASSALPSTARAARGSANCCRTRPRSSMSCASSSRCTPRRSTTTRPSRSFRPGRSWPAGRASARGCPTAWAARTTICRRSSSSSRKAPATRPTSRCTTACGAAAFCRRSIRGSSSARPAIRCCSSRIRRASTPRPAGSMLDDLAELNRIKLEPNRRSGNRHADRPVRAGVSHAVERAGTDRHLRRGRADA